MFWEGVLPFLFYIFLLLPTNIILLYSEQTAKCLFMFWFVFHSGSSLFDVFTTEFVPESGSHLPYL